MLRIGLIDRLAFKVLYYHFAGLVAVQHTDSLSMLEGK